MKQPFTDIHHHLLYGVDDGPKNLKETIQMLRRAAQEGIGRIIATPHVSPGVEPCPFEDYCVQVRQLNDLCAGLHLDIRVDLGAEVLYTSHTPRFLYEGKVPTLAGTDRVLVEFSPDVSYPLLQRALEQILGAGYLPVLAHMERYHCLSSSMRHTRQLKQDYDVFFQLNAHSVLQGSFFQRRYVQRLLKEHLLDAVATDAHNTTSRPAQMKAAWQILRQSCGDDYAAYLTGGCLLLDEA